MEISRKAKLDKLFPAPARKITVQNAASILRRLYPSTLNPQSSPGTSPATPRPGGAE